ncbi:MAG: glucuronate isomerase [Planctomycetaceae bacterium]|jgi:glucuronate isomerase|nr:glucuronate isomerase [Planctomycetaceae bacterium]
MSCATPNIKSQAKKTKTTRNQMIEFITDNFLLESDAAARLYHEYAESLPIIDYHCHLPVVDVDANRQFANLTQIWLEGDHYKWRAMRACGIDEKFITGDAADWQKFQKWAEVTPKTLCNPLYHWTHLELKRPFGIADRLLSPETAKSIWDDANSKLLLPEFSARGIMQQMNVELVCTTDDPVDSLESHKNIAADNSFKIKILPTFRPDKAVQFANPAPLGGSIDEQSIKKYNAYIDRLGEVSGITIRSLDDLFAALKNRHDFFHEHGCRLSDHGFEIFQYSNFESDAALDSRFVKLRNGKVIDETDAIHLQSAILHYIAVLNNDRNWTMQLHIGALRNNNTRFFNRIGADTGFDSIADGNFAKPLSRFLDQLDRGNNLPKTIIYNLNPTANEMLATMLGNFQDGKTPGKMQLGSGWWFLDQKNGMENQIDTVSNLGLLSQFVGMLTDSRSFLSYTRHEYFRRILANKLGNEIKTGSLPNDFNLIGNMVKNICYHNAVNYFSFD